MCTVRWAFIRWIDCLLAIADFLPFCIAGVFPGDKEPFEQLGCLVPASSPEEPGSRSSNYTFQDFTPSTLKTWWTSPCVLLHHLYFYTVEGSWTLVHGTEGRAGQWTRNSWREVMDLIRGLTANSDFFPEQKLLWWSWGPVRVWLLLPYRVGTPPPQIPTERNSYQTLSAILKQKTSTRSILIK